MLIKEVQYDHLGQHAIHADLTRVSMDERVEVTVPIHVRGTAKGVEDGGVLSQMLTELEIECLVTAIPEEIRVSVTNMELDDTLHVEDLEVPEGVKVITEPDTLVVAVKSVEEEVEEEEAVEEEGAEEPEVIGRAKKEEEEEGEQEEKEK